MFVTVIVIYKFAYPQDDEKKFEFHPFGGPCGGFMWI